MKTIANLTYVALELSQTALLVGSAVALVCGEPALAGKAMTVLGLVGKAKGWTAKATTGVVARLAAVGGWQGAAVKVYSNAKKVASLVS